MNDKDGTSDSKPLSEMREDLADKWEGPEVEMTAAEREIWIKELNESLEKARRDIAAGRGIPAEIVMAKMRKRLEIKLNAHG